MYRLVELTQKDIELIIKLLYQELDTHVYHPKIIKKNGLIERYNLIQDLIIKLKQNLQL